MIHGPGSAGVPAWQCRRGQVERGRCPVLLNLVHGRAVSLRQVAVTVVGRFGQRGDLAWCRCLEVVQLACGTDYHEYLHHPGVVEADCWRAQREPLRWGPWHRSYGGPRRPCARTGHGLRCVPQLVVLGGDQD